VQAVEVFRRNQKEYATERLISARLTVSVTTEAKGATYCCLMTSAVGSACAHEHACFETLDGWG